MRAQVAGLALCVAVVSACADSSPDDTTGSPLASDNSRSTSIPISTSAPITSVPATLPPVVTSPTAPVTTVPPSIVQDHAPYPLSAAVPAETIVADFESIYVVETRTSRVLRTILRARDDALTLRVFSQPLLSPDGRTLYVGYKPSSDRTKCDEQVLAVDTTVEIDVNLPPNIVGVGTTPVVSPDGRYLVYSRLEPAVSAGGYPTCRTSGLMLHDLRAGSTVTLHEIDAASYVWSTRWSADSSRLALNSGSANGDERESIVIDIAAAKSARLVVSDDLARRLSQPDVLGSGWRIVNIAFTRRDTVVATVASGAARPIRTIRSLDGNSFVELLPEDQALSFDATADDGTSVFWDLDRPFGSSVWLGLPDGRTFPLRFHANQVAWPAPMLLPNDPPRPRPAIRYVPDRPTIAPIDTGATLELDGDALVVRHLGATRVLYRPESGRRLRSLTYTPDRSRAFLTESLSSQSPKDSFAGCVTWLLEVPLHGGQFATLGRGLEPQISPDGRWLVATGASKDCSPTNVGLYDLRDNSFVRVLGPPLDFDAFAVANVQVDTTGLTFEIPMQYPPSRSTARAEFPKTNPKDGWIPFVTTAPKAESLPPPTPPPDEVPPAQPCGPPSDRTRYECVGGWRIGRDCGPVSGDCGVGLAYYRDGDWKDLGFWPNGGVASISIARLLKIGLPRSLAERWGSDLDDPPI